MLVRIDAAATTMTSAEMISRIFVLPERNVSKNSRITLAGLTAVARSSISLKLYRICCAWNGPRDRTRIAEICHSSFGRSGTISPRSLR
jgi:hypothetical protein